MTGTFKPEAVSRFKKQRFLLDLSEDRFRDEVVRPLFFRQGLRDGRDLCGPSEKGKDALFVTTDKLGSEDIYVVQTKRGKITLSRKVQDNLIEAVTQLRTAAETRVTLISTKRKQLPTKVILCASGSINEAARDHICDEIKDPRLMFLDADELIPKIDEFFPELWLGIDADIAPYFRRLKEIIESSDDSLAMAELLPKESQSGVATDNGFVMLQLYRMVLKLNRQDGQLTKTPLLEQMPITGLLKKRKRLFVIFGSAGSGKSTSLKRLAYVLITKGLKFESVAPTIPVLLRAADIAGSATSLVESCDWECRRITHGTKATFSSEDLIAGRLFVLIDALDELPGDPERLSVLSLVAAFHANYPNCTVVVTSRDHNSVKGLAALKDFDTYNLSPINYRQANQIIKSLQKGKNLPAERSQELCRRLEEVHGMELNPLLVTVFAATSDYSRQDIPANITELFKKFTEMMLGRWDASKGFKHQYQAQLKDFILTKVAFEMHKDKLIAIDVERFNQILTTELANRGYVTDIVQLRDEILNRSGLFLIVGSAIEFRHLMMQEFFAGRGIPSPDYLHSVITDSWWSRAIVFYFGDHPDSAVGLETAISALADRSVEQKYTAALTLGLALQAAYLVEVKHKIDIYRWVVDSLAKAKDEFLAADNATVQFPLKRFLLYYLFGRDSVALSVLQGKIPEIIEGWSGAALSQDDKDVRTFWIIIGLVESGAVDEAEQLVKKFRPSDARLLLGIHLGCYLMETVRVSTPTQRAAAKRICERLSEHVDHLRVQILDEMKTELLEIKEAGGIKTIDGHSPSGEVGEETT